MVHLDNKFRNIISATIGAALMSGALIGTSAHATEWTKASAPITYKGSNPYAVGYASAPQYQAPQYQTPRVQVPQYNPQTALRQPIAPTPFTNMAPTPFNPQAIDPTLYKHQKVGKPYTVAGRTYYPQHDPSYDRIGTASWYGDKFHGKPTANGEIFDKNAMTAAHPTLPLNSYVYVTNMTTGKTLKLRLNDRGPFIDNRMIDLSEAAANALGIRHSGLSEVRVKYAGPSEPNGQTGPYRHSAPNQMAQAPVMPTPRMVTPRVPQPIMPRPHIQQPKAQSYQPLRQQFQPPMKMAEAPRAPVSFPMAPVTQAQGNIYADPTNLGLALPSAPIAIPQASNPVNDDDSVVTLTIKGPIHMANDRGIYPQARLVKAVSRITYKTK